MSEPSALSPIQRARAEALQEARHVLSSGSLFGAQPPIDPDALMILARFILAGISDVDELVDALAEAGALAAAEGAS